ncbi:hypothetical protein [Haloarchaeobius sp. DFWS5]|uniref:hypothetical protein n=1 Tax=Haloarchaeobius sp. DFWS5 TaxID=3446114 RepID=UPI003EB89E93
MPTRNGPIRLFERWGPTTFVVGAVGILITTVVGGLDVAALVQTPAWLHMGPLLFGLWFVFVGLIGFAARVTDSAPRLSLGGLLTSGIGWVALTVGLTAAVVVDLTSERTFIEPGSWAPPLLAGAFVLALLSFLLLGSAAVRAASPSRTVGLLLLVPVAAFFGEAVLLLSKILTGTASGVLQLALSGLIGVVLLVVGYRLRGGPDSAVAAKSQSDTVA